MRAPFILRAFKAGKHVLGEKPVAQSYAEFMQILAAARAANVQYMDAVVFEHSDRLRKMQDDITNGLLGEIRDITTRFCFRVPPDDAWWNQNGRVRSELEPMGCVGDLDTYNVRFNLAMMGYRLPEWAQAEQLAEFQAPGSSAPVPVRVKGQIGFGGGVIATTYSGFDTQFSQLATVIGTHGVIDVDDWVLFNWDGPLKYRLACDTFMPDFAAQQMTAVIKCDDDPVDSANSPDAKMFAAFANLVRSGTVDWSWAERSRITILVQQAMIDSMKQGGARIAIPQG